MSQSVITTAFEQLKAEQAANGGILTLDEFVFANVPDLNITDPIDRGESWPAPEQIVHRQEVSKTGTVNGNAVVYSVVLGAETGDFDFNWIGLINKASNTVAMIVHAPMQKKIKTASGQQGNVLTRSFMMEYNGASQITQITTPADTWQIDFTARLAGMDERIRKENIDIYGAASFNGDSFLVSRDETGYSVKKGVGYVAGLRAELILDKNIAIANVPTKVWVDICWKGFLTSEWGAETKLVVANTLSDYSEQGVFHFVYPIADIHDDGSVIDLRGETITKDIIQTLKNKQPLNEVLSLFSGLHPVTDGIPYFMGEKSASLIKASPLSLKLLKLENSVDIFSELDLLDEKGVMGRKISERWITSTGKYIKTPGAKRARVTIIGAGGGGGGAQGNSPGYVSAGSGGGAGGVSIKTIDLANIESIDVIIGAGGVPGVYSANQPGSGGTTKFGNIMTAEGGGRGNNCGSVAFGVSQLVANGGGGVASGGDINSFGGSGGQALILGQGYTSGGGGNSIVAGGGQPVSSVSTLSGIDGSLGSGGSGAYVLSGGSERTGGRGGDGVCIIEEYA